MMTNLPAAVSIERFPASLRCLALQRAVDDSSRNVAVLSDVAVESSHGTTRLVHHKGEPVTHFPPFTPMPTGSEISPLDTLNDGRPRRVRLFVRWLDQVRTVPITSERENHANSDRRV